MEFRVCTHLTPVFSYSFDSMGRPNKLTDNDSQRPVDWVKDVFYNPAGNVTQTRYLETKGASAPQDVYYLQTHTYNTLYQLTRMTTVREGGGGGTIMDMEYRFSATQNNGKTTQQKDWVSGEEVAYQYDSLQRLIAATTTGHWPADSKDVHVVRWWLMRLPVALALIGLAACGPGTRLREEFQTSDYFMRLEEELSLELSAPVIVLGEVLDVNDAGPPRRFEADRRVGAQLKRIRIRIQTVIKGQVAADDVIEFFYYAFFSRLSQFSVKPTYQPKVGNYRIFFLKPSEAGYRSIRDIKDYTMPVHSGSHRRESCGGMTAGCCIAQILLTPQADIDVKWFSLYLLEPAQIAEVACSQEAALKLLRPLTEYPDVDVADQASQIIADIERRRKK